MIRLASISYSLWKEKIEDGVCLRVYLLGRREPLLLRGNPHRKELGESLHVHLLLTHLCLALLVKERELPFLFNCCYVFSVVVPLDRAVVPLALGTDPTTTPGVIPWG